MRGAIPPIPQYVFMAWFLVKYRDKFTFYLINCVGYVGSNDRLTVKDELERMWKEEAVACF
jgi:glycosylphosphatidylinositol transamidase (GPIT) subunit GPI8